MLGTLAIAALGLGVTACGGSNGDPASGSSAAPSVSTVLERNYSTHNNDRDNDGDRNNDDEKVFGFGQAASTADRRVSVALITSYYAAAAREDGGRACTLLLPIISESVAEKDGHSPALRGRTCAVVMSKLFKLHHRELTQKNATLRVISMRVEGDKALVALDFPTIPEVRQVTERRVGSTWRLLTLLDGILE